MTRWCQRARYAQSCRQITARGGQAGAGSARLPEDVAHFGVAGMALYGSSKAALTLLTKA